MRSIRKNTTTKGLMRSNRGGKTQKLGHVGQKEEKSRENGQPGMRMPETANKMHANGESSRNAREWVEKGCGIREEI